MSTVSPTQAAVEQAKSEVREEININRGKNNKIYQIGGKDRRNSKSKSSSIKKKKIVSKKEKVKRKV